MPICMEDLRACSDCSCWSLLRKEEGTGGREPMGVVSPRLDTQVIQRVPVVP